MDAHLTFTTRDEILKKSGSCTGCGNAAAGVHTEPSVDWVFMCRNGRLSGAINGGRCRVQAEVVTEKKSGTRKRD